MQEETSSNLSKKQPSKWTQNKLGVFWVKTRENGKPYLSGQLEIDGKKIPCFIFKNDYQEGNTPHFQIFEVTE